MGPEGARLNFSGIDFPVPTCGNYPLGATRAVHFDLLARALCQEFEFHAIDARVLEQIAPTGAHTSHRVSVVHTWSSQSSVRLASRMRAFCSCSASRRS